MTLEGFDPEAPDSERLRLEEAIARVDDVVRRLLRQKALYLEELERARLPRGEAR